MNLNNEPAIDFLALPGCRTESREDGRAHVIVYASHEQVPVGCPKCKLQKLALVGQKVMQFWDIPHLGRPTRIELIVPIFACLNCGHAFKTPLEWMHPTRNMTRRLVDYILARVATFDTFALIGRDTGQYTTTIMNVFLEAFTLWDDTRGATLPIKVGIDEIYVGRSCYTILVDAESGASVDLLPDRQSKTIVGRFQSAPNANEVRFVTMDFTEEFRDAVSAALPNALVVADHFHFKQVIEKAFNEVRKHVQKGIKRQFVKAQLSRYTQAELEVPAFADFFSAQKRKLTELADERVKEFRKHRLLLSKRPDELSSQENLWVLRMIKDYPVLNKGWQVKNAGLEIIPPKRRIEKNATSGAALLTETQVKSRLDEWVRSTDGDLRRFYSRPRRIISRWCDEIARIPSSGLSNAMAESKNRFIRMVNAQGRGLHFGTLRARLLWADAFRSAGNRLPALHD